MAALAALGGVEHNEEMVGIGMDLGNLVALNTVSDGEGWKPNTSVRAWIACSSHWGMSTHTSLSLRWSNTCSSSTRRCSTPPSDTNQMSIRLTPSLTVSSHDPAIPAPDRTQGVRCALPVAFWTGDRLESCRPPALADLRCGGGGGSESPTARPKAGRSGSQPKAKAAPRAQQLARMRS